MSLRRGPWARRMFLDPENKMLTLRLGAWGRKKPRPAPRNRAGFRISLFSAAADRHASGGRHSSAVSFSCIQSSQLPGSAAAIPIWFVNGATWDAVRAGLDDAACRFAQAAGFEPVSGRHAFLPGPDGTLAGVLFGQENDAARRDAFLAGKLAGVLPPGTYRFANAPH